MTSHDIPWEILVGFTILSYRLHGLRERDVGGPGGPWGALGGPGATSQAVARVGDLALQMAEI